jgi:DNA processing protein
MSACDACLRRAHAIALMAARIEGLLQKPSERVKEVLSLGDQELIEALVPAERRAEVTRALGDFAADNSREQTERAGLRALCRHDEDYPDTLRPFADRPPVLWLRDDGDRFADLLTAPAVAIVGSRRASAYGLEVAEELGRGLSTAGVTVISGMALGIDGAAHRGALRSAEPRTIAVLGNGADVVYPRNHRRLYESIGEVGVILSELPPGRRPFRWTFPARNRIMAALAQMTIVVEAAEPSGSLITAVFAEHMNRSVGAVPGRVTSATAAGSNKLLRDGAAVIRHAGDVLDELFGAGAAERLADVEAELAGFGGVELRVLEAVEHGADAGAMAAALGLDPGQVRATLGRLELAGAIRRTGIGSYERRAARHP